MVDNAPELDQRLALTSAFDTSGDFSFTVLQSSRVHFAEVDRMVGFYLHDERFSFISELRDFGYLLVVKLPKYKLPE
jgi:hypothetical protein